MNESLLIDQLTIVWLEGGKKAANVNLEVWRGVHFVIQTV